MIWCCSIFPFSTSRFRIGPTFSTKWEPPPFLTIALTDCYYCMGTTVWVSLNKNRPDHYYYSRTRKLPCKVIAMPRHTKQLTLQMTEEHLMIWFVTSRILRSCFHSVLLAMNVNTSSCVIGNGKNAYEILEVDSKCSTETLKASYKRLLLKNHPDKGRGDGESFQRLQSAWKLVCCPEERRKYDMTPNSGAFGSSESLSFSDFQIDGNKLSKLCRCGDYYHVGIWFMKRIWNGLSSSRSHHQNSSYITHTEEFSW